MWLTLKAVWLLNHSNLKSKISNRINSVFHLQDSLVMTNNNNVACLFLLIMLGRSTHFYFLGNVKKDVSAESRKKNNNHKAPKHHRKENLKMGKPSINLCNPSLSEKYKLNIHIESSQLSFRSSYNGKYSKSKLFYFFIFFMRAGFPNVELKRNVYTWRWCNIELFYHKVILHSVVLISDI